MAYCVRAVQARWPLRLAGRAHPTRAVCSLRCRVRPHEMTNPAAESGVFVGLRNLRHRSHKRRTGWPDASPFAFLIIVAVATSVNGYSSNTRGLKNSATRGSMKGSLISSTTGSYHWATQYEFNRPSETRSSVVGISPLITARRDPDARENESTARALCSVSGERSSHDRSGSPGRWFGDENCMPCVIGSVNRSLRSQLRRPHRSRT